MNIEAEATQHLHRAATDARSASRILGRAPAEIRNAALRAMASAMRQQRDNILAANAADLAEFSGLGVSGKTGAGLDALISRITDVLQGQAASPATITRARHRQAIALAIQAMESARTEICNGPERAELAAEDLRRAIRALDQLVGRVDVEQILGEIFASFCIGK